MAAVLAAIGRLGWAARGPLDWVTAEGDPAPVGDLAALKTTVHGDFRKREWAVVAGKRPDFRAAGCGVDEALTGEPCRRLARRGRARQAGRLRCILAGGDLAAGQAGGGLGGIGGLPALRR